MSAALASVFVAAGLGLAVAQRWLVPAREPATLAPEPAPRGARVYLFVLLLVAAGVRLWLTARYPQNSTEGYALVRACDFEWTSFTGTIQGAVHGPLQALATRAWLGLDDALGLGMGVLALRLPVFVLGVVSVWLLARLGKHLGAPLAGLAAATLFAFTTLPIRVSIPQENYAFEAAGGLLFAERLACVLAARRHAFGSLGIAAALALWSGYMNLPALGVGAATFLAVALRRRRIREVLYTLAVAALLVAPILPALWEGVTGYFAMQDTRAIALGPDEVRGGVELHDPAKSFSEGRFLGGLLAITDALFGVASPLFFVGAAALAALQTWRALPLLAVAFAFPAAGTVILLNPPNYAAALPLYFLVATWGLGALCRRVLAGRPRALAIEAALLAASVGVGLPSSLARLPFFSEESGRFYYLPFTELAPLERLRDALPADTPVLRADYLDAPVLNRAFCGGEGSACASARCAHHGGAPRLDGEGPGPELASWNVERRGERLMVRVRRPEGRHEPPEALVASFARLLERPIWSRRGAIVLGGGGQFVEPHLSLLHRALAARCPTLAREATYTLGYCAPAQLAALRAEAATLSSPAK